MIPDDVKASTMLRGKLGTQSMLDIGIKYTSYDDLVKVNSPGSVYTGLEANLGADQDWQKQVAALNELRSVMKFNINVIEESPLTIFIFKKVSLLVTNMKSAISKLSMLVLQEGIPKLSNALIKLSTIFLQQFYSKLADSNSFLLQEVEKTLDALYIHCPANRIAVCLITFSDHKSPSVKCQIAKGFSKCFERLQKEIFLFKDYEKITKVLAGLSKDANPDVRRYIRDCIKELSELSDQPDLVLKTIQRHSGRVSTQQKSICLDSSTRDEGLSKRNKRKVGLQLKRLASNKLANLNRTEELVKEIPPVSISVRNNKHMFQHNIIKNDDEVDDMANKKPLALMQRKRNPTQLARTYPELEALGELISDLEKEGNLDLLDWQGKIESLKISTTLIVEHEAKFIRSVYLVRFFNAFMKLLDDFNQKIQIEALNSLKSDLRSTFKVAFYDKESA